MKAFCAGAIAVAMITMTIALSGCGQEAPSQAAKPEPPAKLDGHVVKEAELTTITLTPDAERRLGIQVKAAQMGAGEQPRRFAGEVTAPLGNSFVVSSSVAGTVQAAAGVVPPVGSFVGKDQPIFRLTPLVAGSRDIEVTAEAELDQARTRLETARMRKARADKMLADEVGTIRAVEEAQQEVELAMTAVQAAEVRYRRVQSAPLDADVQMVVRAPQEGILRQILAAPGQTVSAGALLFEVVDLRTVWIRVPVYAGEASTLVTTSPVTVQALNGGGTSWTAIPVTAPPSGDPTTSTINLYYSIPNPALRFRPGEKLMVTLRGADSGQWVRIPSAAVVFDTQGGTWVYETLGDRRYARRRVDVDHVTSGLAYLAAGIAAGTKVVTDGAAELWGFEFGTGK
jgi:membrane fusion protein, heavy metal efflux system